MEDGVTLNSLLNTEQDGNFLKESIQVWLDEEYIPQSCHEDLGNKVKKVYVTNRSKGISDLGEMMMDVGTSLESYDMGDAFVGPWDVANKVSDFLMVRLEREICACAGDLSKFVESNEIIEEAVTKVDVVSVNGLKEDLNGAKDADGAVMFISFINRLDIDNRDKGLFSNMNEDFDGMDLMTPLRLSSKQKVFKPIPAVKVESKILLKTASDLRTEFSRYKLLRDFLEGDVEWANMHAVIALCLGFRVTDGKVLQDLTVEPIGWDGLDIVPDLSNLNEDLIARRMFADLPEDEGATDIVIETLAGLEMYQKMKASPDQEIQRRILLGKWLYVQGFFNDQFPPLIRFTPAHMSDNDDDEDINEYQ
eukprot:CAMPEP_0119042694 /NCGR_PEP_ID=MMETSP1177-20130426/16090_1 /TAXON_ID=2985 /ORGANISM="Ochromonas sp, Strain CCMP1899" /LENGTH=363 /DNA_ID=CAMNT_0007009663 /DNA_START=185 /DNA_END=1276 /DNA_ORIENTATION=+